MGLATARMFAESGASVVLGDLDGNLATKEAERIVVEGGTAIGVACDVTDEAQDHCGLPPVIRTLGDAIDLIDKELPETVRFQPAWREVKDMLITAAELRTGVAVEVATTLLERVLDMQAG